MSLPHLCSEILCLLRAVILKTQESTVPSQRFFQVSPWMSGRAALGAPSIFWFSRIATVMECYLKLNYRFESDSPYSPLFSVPLSNLLSLFL